MTYDEVLNIAKRLDKETKVKIDKEVDERLAILKEGDLNEEDMAKMEECLYMSLVIQEYLNGEYELLEEEKALLLDEMEELYNEYGELLTKAKLEEKLSKKKRMALELMRIREQLFDRKEFLKNVKENIKTNKESNDKLKELSSKETMKEVAKESKKDLANPDKQSKIGLDMDMRAKPNNKKTETKIEETNITINNTTVNKYSTDKKTNDKKEKVKDVKAKSVVDSFEKAIEDVPNQKEEQTPLHKNADEAINQANML